MTDSTKPAQDPLPSDRPPPTRWLGPAVGIMLIAGLKTRLSAFLSGALLLAFALAMALGAKSLSGAFRRVSQVERWARVATGVLFVGVGIYFCLVYIFQVTG